MGALSGGRAQSIRLFYGNIYTYTSQYTPMAQKRTGAALLARNYHPLQNWPSQVFGMRAEPRSCRLVARIMWRVGVAVHAHNRPTQA